MCFSCSSSFSPSLLNDLPKLKKFMSGESAIKDIQYYAKNPNLVHVPSSKRLYFSRWKVAWIYVTAPFNWLISLFFSLIAKILHYTPFSSMERRFTVYSKQMMRNLDLLDSQNKYKERLLVPAFNLHQTFSGDIYKYQTLSLNNACQAVKKMTFSRTCIKEGLKKAVKVFYKTIQPNISKVELKNVRKTLKEMFNKKGINKTIDWLKRKHPSVNLQKAINKLYLTFKSYQHQQKSWNSLYLFSDNGLCRGASLWFNNLYLKSKHLFSDPEKALISVANRFNTGVPRQAALLHAFDRTEKGLLGLKNEEMKANKVWLYELDHNKEAAIEKIKALPVGVYRVGVFRHSISYIKISENQSYIFNPNYGLIKLTGNDHAAKLLKEIKDHHYESGHPLSHIYFEKQTMA